MTPDQGVAANSCPWSHAPRRFKEKPDTPFGLIDPVFEEARGRDVFVLLAKLVQLLNRTYELQVIVSELREHVERRHVVGVVVQDALLAADLANRSDRRAADLARPLCDVVGCFENLRSLLVEQKVVVAEVRTRYVPVEVLRFDVQREEIGEECA